MSENPYAPPRAQALGEAPEQGLFASLKSQRTLRLLGLGLVTYGVYYAHYCARQSRIVDQYLPPGAGVPGALLATLYVLSYASLGLFFAYLMVNQTHPLAAASDVADRLWLLALVIWGFVARNRVNRAAGFTRDDPRWFHGVWTFLFTPLYFNYKVNALNEPEPIEAAA